jgi:pimeloyl-ACP methyl ester carboxylesterase
MTAQASDGDKVLICHGTASETNQWELISVTVSALSGHFDGVSYDEPGHGWQNAHDFFPQDGRTDCSGGPDGGGGEESEE